MRGSDHLFCFVSFEGPDDYARVGGLATRVCGIVEGLAVRGHEAHLFYFGDPRLPAVARVGGGHLTLHRWAQWLSAGCRGGVYEAEDARRWDLATSLPSYLLDELIRPMIRARFTPVILAMEWQCLDFLRALDGLLRCEGLRRMVTLAWDLSAASLGRVAWSALPEDLRLLSRENAVVRAGTASGTTVTPIADGVEGLLSALLSGAAQSAEEIVTGHATARVRPGPVPAYPPGNAQRSRPAARAHRGRGP
jgi:hypothetical protein